MTFLQFLFFFLLMMVIVKAVQRLSYRRRSHSGHKDRDDKDFWSMDASGMDMDMDCGTCGLDGLELETDDDRMEKAKAGVRERVRKADARIEVLETRIRKLERTVTDRSYRLSEEIENL